MLFVDLAIHDQGRDAFVAISKLIAAATGLVAPVQLVEVRCVIGVQNSQASVFRRPQNCAACTVGGDARGRGGVGMMLLL
jgi:hypothetical protein